MLQLNFSQHRTMQFFYVALPNQGRPNFPKDCTMPQHVNVEKRLSKILSKRTAAMVRVRLTSLPGRASIGSSISYGLAHATKTWLRLS
jgi:hypothetical protein